MFAAGGWTIGDRVVLTIPHTPMNIARGDVGTISGPCTANLVDNEQRVSVDFGAGKGFVNCHATTTLVTEAEWPQRKKDDDERVLAAGGCA